MPENQPSSPLLAPDVPASDIPASSAPASRATAQSAQTGATLFRDGKLTIGLVLPLRADDSPDIDLAQQIEWAVLADDLGFDAVWVRDVPLNGPWYPENFGHGDPMVMLGAIATRTSRLAIGTAASVLPLRHPLHLAKSAITLANLSQGRFIMGVGSGDRPEEYEIFGQARTDHKILYRDHWQKLAAALEQPPRILSGNPDSQDNSDTDTDNSSDNANQIIGPPENWGIADRTEFELRPAAKFAVPMLAVGSGGQTLEWIARHATGWATYHRPPEKQRGRYNLWRRAVLRTTPDTFKSFSTALRIELLENPDAPASDIDLGYRLGIRALPGILAGLRDAGTHHVMINLVPISRPVPETLSLIAPVLGRF